jgi:hypothetical protein
VQLGIRADRLVVGQAVVAILQQESCWLRRKTTTRLSECLYVYVRPSWVMSIDWYTRSFSVMEKFRENLADSMRE